jgi:hypothetical protein
MRFIYQMYQKVSKLNQTRGAMAPLTPWLTGFIKIHGVNQTTELLRGIGVVEKKTFISNDNEVVHGSAS